ncbi:hypothetical protein, partial [Endozoicomonas sp. YOMI1]|uniref:hypothetical protein n=1 Tax=Endozoicomonas sp. YOMI1 TaxID=2828739 RepID=UPI0021476C56
NFDISVSAARFPPPAARKGQATFAFAASSQRPASLTSLCQIRNLIPGQFLSAPAGPETPFYQCAIIFTAECC